MGNEDVKILRVVSCGPTLSRKKSDLWDSNRHLGFKHNPDKFRSDTNAIFISNNGWRYNDRPEFHGKYPTHEHRLSHCILIVTLTLNSRSSLITLRPLASHLHQVHYLITLCDNRVKRCCKPADFLGTSQATSNSLLFKCLQPIFPPSVLCKRQYTNRYSQQAIDKRTKYNHLT